MDQAKLIEGLVLDSLRLQPNADNRADLIDRLLPILRRELDPLNRAIAAFEALAHASGPPLSPPWACLSAPQPPPPQPPPNL
jgi:hypothetical protein